MRAGAVGGDEEDFHAGVEAAELADDAPGTLYGLTPPAPAPKPGTQRKHNITKPLRLWVSRHSVDTSP